MLATGLGSSAQRGAIYRVLASHVAERAMLGDVRERVARAVSEPSANAATPKDWMATGAPAAVALFAHDPLDRPRGLGEP